MFYNVKEYVCKCWEQIAKLYIEDWEDRKQKRGDETKKGKSIKSVSIKEICLSYFFSQIIKYCTDLKIAFESSSKELQKQFR